MPNIQTQTHTFDFIVSRPAVVRLCSMLCVLRTLSMHSTTVVGYTHTLHSSEARN